MAQDRTDDELVEEGIAGAKILGLPKKTAIIAASALLVVIIAASSYFLLAGEKAPEEVASQTPGNSEILNPIEQKQAATSIDTDEKMTSLQTEVFDLREQIIQLKEENLVLKKQIYDFETQKPNPTQQNNDLTKLNPYKKSQPLEFKDYPPIEPAVPVEKPKPKWG